MDPGRQRCRVFAPVRLALLQHCAVRRPFLTGEVPCRGHGGSPS